MSYYWNKKFLKHLNINDIKNIIEVGARYGDESISLSKIFINANVYAFEPNPLVIEKTKNKLKDKSRIKFFDYGLGEKEEELPFYPYLNNHDDNIGCSSFLKRIDYEKTQIECENKIKVRILDNICKEENINSIDLLCLDTQGFELNVLKGAKEILKEIKYIIMEQPKEVIDTRFLPPNIHSKYVDAPNHNEIKDFMTSNGFVEIERIPENMIEDNVMWKNGLK